VRLGKVRLGKAGMARTGEALRGETWQGRKSAERRVSVWYDAARQEWQERLGGVRQGKAWSGKAG